MYRPSLETRSDVIPVSYSEVLRFYMS